MKILFVVNPIAGGIIKNFSKYPSLYLDHSKCSYDIVFTEYAGHAELLAKDSDADIIVAVGGDGTVNEIGRALIGTRKVLGIIPCGSGNGLARHLGLTNYLDTFEAIKHCHITQMDVGLINENVFFCTCGIGLDAEVSSLFADSNKRGFLMYCIDTLKAWIHYSPKKYVITVDGTTYTEEAILVTVGNANQWGNNAQITPEASICDGALDITVLHEFKTKSIPRIILQLLTGHLYNNRSAIHYRGKNIHIQRSTSGPAHFDGDPLYLEKTINISLANRKVRVLYGSKDYSKL